MLISLTMWLAMSALAAACGQQLGFSNALVTWTVLAAVACVGGATLISRQPLGVATMGGRIGTCFVRWGFRAGHGRLIPAALISWLIWLLLGTAIMGAIRFPAHLPIIATWTGDSLGLFYVVGIMISNRGGRVPPSLVKLVASLIGLIAGSAFLWFHFGTDGARALAVSVAGGPPLFVGIGYGFVLATSLLAGGKHR